MTRSPILLLSTIIGLFLSSVLFTEAATKVFSNTGEAAPAGVVSREAGTGLSALPTVVREKISGHLKKAAYEVTASKAAKSSGKSGIYQAINQGQQLKVSFTTEGIELRPGGKNAGQWQVGMSLAGYGYKGAVQPLKPNRRSKITAQSNRIEYDRNQLTEWYVNDERGIEQGVVLMAPPAGEGSSNVVIEWAVSGTLRPRLGKQGELITFREADNEQVLECSGLKAWDATGRSLVARMIVKETKEAYRIGYEVNTKGAVYPVTIDPVYTPVKKLLAADGMADAHFGYSVAIDADTVVVGAHWDATIDIDAGAAYIFSRNQGGANNWGQVKKLVASDGAAGDEFGKSVAISGDTVVVGAYYDDTGTTVSDHGSAYIFSRNQGGANNWGQVKKILSSDYAEGDNFGISAAIDGDTVVVGSYLSDAADIDAGAAYVFYQNQGGANNWGQVKKLVASDGAAGDEFGNSVGISVDTVVIGAYYADAIATDSGSAYVFSRDQGGADNWGQVKKLVAGDGAAGDQFGNSVALDGDIAVVGAFYDDDKGSSSGSGYIFSRDQGGADNWGQVKKLTANDGAALDFFGMSVAVSGDIVVVGAHYDDDLGSNSGAGYIFSRNQGGANNWGQASKFTAGDGAAGDQFGISVSLSADTVVVGAPFDDDNFDGSGSAYVGSISTVLPTTTTTSVPTTTTTSVRPTTTTTSIRPTTTTTVSSTTTIQPTTSTSLSSTTTVRPTTTTSLIIPTTTTSVPTTTTSISSTTTIQSTTTTSLSTTTTVQPTTITTSVRPTTTTSVQTTTTSQPTTTTTSVSSTSTVQSTSTSTTILPTTTTVRPTTTTTSVRPTTTTTVSSTTTIRPTTTTSVATTTTIQPTTTTSVVPTTTSSISTTTTVQPTTTTTSIRPTTTTSVQPTTSVSSTTTIRPTTTTSVASTTTTSAPTSTTSVRPTTTTVVMSTTTIRPTTTIQPTTSTTVQPTTTTSVAPTTTIQPTTTTTSVRPSTTTTSVQPTTTSLPTTTTTLVSSTSTVQSTSTSMQPATTTVRPTTTIVPPPTTTSSIPKSTTTSSVQTTTTTVQPTTSSIVITTSVLFSTTTSTIRICPIEEVSNGDQGKLSLVRQYRDKVLRKTPAGRAYVKLFYRHSLEVTAILVKNPSIAADARNILNTLLPEVKAATQEKSVTIGQAQIDGIISVLNAIGSEASADLYRSIQWIKRDLRQKSVLGKMGIKNK